MMKSRVEETIARHDKGYNCAQAVVCTYCDLLGIDEETAFKMSEGFGFGMGMTEVCGAVSGMTFIAGLKNSDGNLSAPKTKRDTYTFSRKMAQKFKEKNGSYICAELKGIRGGKVLRSCPGCIADAAKIIEEQIFPDTFEKYDGNL
ncbi:MAG: C-GCAxxG-C-C family protein [Lachnospirales bacterium]